MPLVLAFHTTFVEPSTFCVPVGRRWVVDEHLIPTGELAELTEKQKMYVQGCSSRNIKVDGFYEMAGDTARVGNYSFHVEGFDQWVLFNGGGDKNFLCIEPQLGPVNALNTGGYKRLEPGESYRVKLLIGEQ